MFVCDQLAPPLTVLKMAAPASSSKVPRMPMIQPFDGPTKLMPGPGPSRNRRVWPGSRFCELQVVPPSIVWRSLPPLLVVQPSVPETKATWPRPSPTGSGFCQYQSAEAGEGAIARVRAARSGTREVACCFMPTSLSGCSPILDLRAHGAAARDDTTWAGEVEGVSPREPHGADRVPDRAAPGPAGADSAP